MREKECTGPCGRKLPGTLEYFYRRSPGRLMPRCKDCKNAENAAYFANNADEARATRREWSRRKRAEFRALGLCVQCGKRKAKNLCKVCAAARRAWGDKNRQYVRDLGKRTRDKLRADIFAAYGGLVCACCGETEPLFLTIDHVNGGGKREREAAGGGEKLWAKLRRDGYPPGYQVLCFNCNCGRARNGGICPHKTEVASCA